MSGTTGRPNKLKRYCNFIVLYRGRITTALLIIFIFSLIGGCRRFGIGCAYAVNYCDSENPIFSSMATYYIGKKCEEKNSKIFSPNGCSNDLRYFISTSTNELICGSNYCEDINITIKNKGSSVIFGTDPNLQLQTTVEYKAINLSGIIILSGKYALPKPILNSGDESTFTTKLQKYILNGENIGNLKRNEVTLTFRLYFESKGKECAIKEGGSTSTTYKRMGNYNGLCVYAACGDEINELGCKKIYDKNKSFQILGYTYLANKSIIRNASIAQKIKLNELETIPGFDAYLNQRYLYLYCGENVSSNDEKEITKELKESFSSINILKVDKKQVDIIKNTFGKCEDKCLSGTNYFEGIRNINLSDSINNTFNPNIVDNSMNTKGVDKYDKNKFDCIFFITTPKSCKNTN